MRFTVIKIILLLIFAFNEKAYSKKFDLEALKEACSSIGFKIKTEKHGECVLELHKRSDKLKLYKVVTKEKSSEPQKTKSKQATSTEYSSYFEAKNECSKKGMTVSSNYNKWICYSPNESNYTQVEKKHCSELYGCGPEKYDQEIEAEARVDEQRKKSEEYYKNWPAYRNYISKHRYISFNEWVERRQTNNFKSTNQQDTNFSDSFVDQARVNKNVNSSYSGEGLGGFIEDLLTVGIVIGGAYLLGTALTPATPPPVGTTNVFTTINENRAMLISR